MSVVAITGNDTLTLFDRVLNNLADGTVSQISFPNDLISVKTGKNKNSLYARNATGSNADLTLRVVRGSSDDRFLQARLSQQRNDLPSFTLAGGQLVKRLGDGQGNITTEIYELEGGAFLREVEGMDNVEGDTDAAVAVYQMRFAVAPRSLG